MKLLCKKGLPNYYIFKTGEYYPFKIRIWYLTVDDNGFAFYFSNKQGVDFYIWDYFYTPQEIRKLKLQKLNETTL